MTGYPGAEVVGGPLPAGLEPLAGGRDCEMHGDRARTAARTRIAGARTA